MRCHGGSATGTEPTIMNTFLADNKVVATQAAKDLPKVPLFWILFFFGGLQGFNKGYAWWQWLGAFAILTVSCILLRMSAIRAEKFDAEERAENDDPFEIGSIEESDRSQTIMFWLKVTVVAAALAFVLCKSGGAL